MKTQCLHHISSAAEQYKCYRSGKPEAASPLAMHSQTGLKDILSECGEAAGGISSWIHWEEDPWVPILSEFTFLLTEFPDWFLPLPYHRRDELLPQSSRCSFFNLISCCIIIKLKRCLQITNQQHYKCTANRLANQGLAFSHCMEVGITNIYIYTQVNNKTVQLAPTYMEMVTLLSTLWAFGGIKNAEKGKQD